MTRMVDLLLEPIDLRSLEFRRLGIAQTWGEKPIFLDSVKLVTLI
jgi:hypothetical protein